MQTSQAVTIPRKTRIQPYKNNGLILASKRVYYTNFYMSTYDVKRVLYYNYISYDAILFFIFMQLLNLIAIPLKKQNDILLLSKIK